MLHRVTLQRATQLESVAAESFSRDGNEGAGCDDDSDEEEEKSATLTNLFEEYDDDDNTDVDSGEELDHIFDFF